MRVLVHMGLVAALTACGSAGFGGKDGDKSNDSDDDPADQADPSQGAAQSHHSLLVQDATALPACDAAAEGWLVYLKTEAKFQSCAAGAWTDVEIKTAAVPTGDTIAAHYNCDGSGDLDPADDVETKGMVAKIDVLSSGWKFISCMDRSFDTTYTYADSSSDTYSWPPNSASVSCVPFYVGGSFDVATEKFTWKAHTGGQTEVVACKKS